ncbi:hypothetical protein P5673_005794 [Acropora cervicornis]|uniref:Uncharacterized protein n=1 Tax=Acropora cervicornis TaxID=6130 RepID=A0AAD9QZE6_ACRCE|nr:hypothetical protein P5673_005794 [Acropora cervicornis]
MANVEGPLNAQRKRFGTDISAVFKQNIFPDKEENWTSLGEGQSITLFDIKDFCLGTAEVLSEIDGGYCVNRIARKSAAIHLSEVSSTFNYIFVNAKLDFHVKLRLLKSGQTTKSKRKTFKGSIVNANTRISGVRTLCARLFSTRRADLKVLWQVTLFGLFRSLFIALMKVLSSRYKDIGKGDHTKRHKIREQSYEAKVKPRCDQIESSFDNTAISPEGNGYNKPDGSAEEDFSERRLRLDPEVFVSLTKSYSVSNMPHFSLINCFSLHTENSLLKRDSET